MTDATKDRRRIVVGVDGSEESFAALAWAIDESRALDASLNAIYGWTPSWEVGSEPDNKEAWDAAYERIEATIREWVATNRPEADDSPDSPHSLDTADSSSTQGSLSTDDTTDARRETPDTPVTRETDDLITFTSVHGTGQAALLTLGSDAEEIVVGRRNLNAILRWFLGSTSASLAQTAKVPVTVVKMAAKHAPTTSEKTDTAAGITSTTTGSAGAGSGSDSGSGSNPDADTAFDLSDAATLTGETLEHLDAPLVLIDDEKPIVVGIDGSSDSVRALRFAVAAAQRSARPLRVLFCWQLRDLGVIPGYENAIAPLKTAQTYANDILRRSLAEVDIPTDVEIRSSATHISAVKGLSEASEFAQWLIIGSRGLSGIDARVLGSVSSRLVDASRCTITVVH